MTVKECKETFENIPIDTEVWLHVGSCYRRLHEIKVEKLWIDGKHQDVVIMDYSSEKIK